MAGRNPRGRARGADEARGDRQEVDGRRGPGVRGRSDPRRTGAVRGVSDASADEVRPGAAVVVPAGSHRADPPLVEHAGTGDGGIAGSGGSAAAA